MRETDLQDLQHSAASLLLYQEILNHPLARAGLEFIEAVACSGSEVELRTAYGRLFRQMAELQVSWRQFWIQQIERADNPFSREVAQAQGDLDPIPAPLLQAARQDLENLERLASGLERLRVYLRSDHLWVEWPDPETLPAWADSAWSEACTELAQIYQTRGVGVCGQFHALRWQQGLRGIPLPDPVQLEDLRGYERQKQQLCINTEALIAGRGALHVLLYGARGTGKSSMVKAMVNRYGCRGLRLLEVNRGDLRDLPEILEELRRWPHPFILFVDDLSFEADETEFKHLKVLLEGDIAAQPQRVRLYATTNRRHLIREFFPDRPSPASDEVHAWDTVQEKLSLGDRFGLTLTFLPLGQAEYLATVEHLLPSDPICGDQQVIQRLALQWAQAQNGFSGRTARQFVDSLRAGLVELP